MISAFHCKDTQSLYEGTRIAKWVNIERSAVKKLQALDAAVKLGDLRSPGNSLEKLKGNREGQHSIRINDQGVLRMECRRPGKRRNRGLPLKEGGVMAKREVPLVPPGEILKEDFMEPLGLSINALSRSVGLTPTCISEIIRNRRNITPETAIKLGHFFKTTPQFWMNLQTNYDIAVAQENFVEAG